MRAEKPKREGESTLLYPFDARVAWVAACHHRTSSRITWDLWSSAAVRLEPLFADLLPALSSTTGSPGRLACGSRSRSVRRFDFEASPLQLRGVVKNALVEALASRGVAADVDAESPDVVFVVRRTGTPEARRTVVGIDIGGGTAASRVARAWPPGPAPLRETMAAQLILLSRWDARTEPLVDPMCGRRHDSESRRPASRRARRFVVRRISRSAISPRSRIFRTKRPTCFPEPSR